jgi:subtilase family protein
MHGRRLAVVAASAIALVSATVTTPAHAGNKDDTKRTTTTEHHRRTTTTDETTVPPRRSTTTDAPTSSTDAPRRTTTTEAATSTTAPQSTPSASRGEGDSNDGSTTTTAASEKSDTKRFIVVLKPGTAPDPVANEHKNARHFHVERVYGSALQGYVGDMTDGDVSAVQHDPRVAYVQPVHGVQIDAQILPWGVDEVSHLGNQVSSTHPGDGAGTVNGDVYIVDTGVQANPDINGGTDANLKDSSGLTDCNGHGTHMAGIIGALDNTVGVVGVAPGVHIHGVKVLDCKGRGTDVNAISGLNWIKANGHAPAVINMSFGGPISPAFDDAVKNLVASGYTVTVAAGNNRKNACSISPAHLGSLPGILDVGAVTKKDGPAGFSNFGPCVDMWAPGVAIPSLFLNGNLAIASGTSASSPHVAGGAALWLANHSGTPADVEAALKAAAISLRHGTFKNGPFIRLNVASF